MKTTVYLLLIIFYLLPGCSRGDLTVNIIRNPLIKFDLDSSSWKADNYSFTGPTTVVVYPSNPLLPGNLYYRFTLQANGRDNKGNNLIFNLVFDASDFNQLSGDYRVIYSTEKGLQQVQLFNTGSTLSAFALCPNDSITPILKVQKQSLTERLITGTFQMTLCNTRDTAQKIRITNGILTDIHY
jgi:hypothetical protein